MDSYERDGQLSEPYKVLDISQQMDSCKYMIHQKDISLKSRQLYKRGSFHMIKTILIYRLITVKNVKAVLQQNRRIMNM